MSEKILKTVKIKGHKVDIVKPTVKGKKYTAIIDDKKRISFGAKNMD